MNTIFRTFLICGILLSLTACTGPLKINEADNGKTINLPTGKTMELTLEGNPTTGYSWLVTSVDENILSVNGEPDYKSDSDLTGSGGTFVFSFTAANPGTTQLELGYLRPWEEDVDPIEMYTVTIVVE